MPAIWPRRAAPEDREARRDRTAVAWQGTMAPPVWDWAWAYDTIRGQDEANRAWIQAHETAEAALKARLSPAQAETLRSHGWFDVTSSRGRRWRIVASGQTGNVYLMDGPAGDVAGACYCAHPVSVPHPAAWLAQMLTLILDEDQFLAVANPMGVPLSMAHVLPAQRRFIDAILRAP
jgi:hypothetical protein